jgi:HEAT repeat protein
MLADADTRVASAAAAALGEIGSKTAATALGQFLPTAPPRLQAAVADACLVAASRLRTDGSTAEAATLLSTMTTDLLPAHVAVAILAARQHR